MSNNWNFILTPFYHVHFPLEKWRGQSAVSKFQLFQSRWWIMEQSEQSRKIAYSFAKEGVWTSWDKMHQTTNGHDGCPHLKSLWTFRGIIINHWISVAWQYKASTRECTNVADRFYRTSVHFICTALYLGQAKCEHHWWQNTGVHKLNNSMTVQRYDRSMQSLYCWYNCSKESACNS